MVMVFVLTYVNLTRDILAISAWNYGLVGKVAVQYRNMWYDSQNVMMNPIWRSHTTFEQKNSSQWCFRAIKPRLLKTKTQGGSFFCPGPVDIGFVLLLDGIEHQQAPDEGTKTFFVLRRSLHWFLPLLYLPTAVVCDDQIECIVAPTPRYIKNMWF